ncbi:DoxX family protein [Larkinella harenae]
MANGQKSSHSLHLILWSTQLILALSFGWAAWMKLFQPIDQLALMWPWTAQVPVALTKFTGFMDLLGALGLVIPSLLRIKPVLTPVAAMGAIVLMIFASVFHIVRGEASSIGVNIAFAALAAFVAWGRWKKVPILPKTVMA